MSENLKAKTLKKVPWKPKMGERYYFPRVDADIKSKAVVDDFDWEFLTFDYAMMSLGMAYRTREEAESNLSKDYEKLTGKKLGE